MRSYLVQDVEDPRINVQSILTRNFRIRRLFGSRFEHLSVEAMEAAISDLCRVTRCEICVGFFNMHDGEEHIARPVRDYHWNCLSLRRTKAIFGRCASRIRARRTDGFLRSNFCCCDTHNKRAYTFFVSL